MQQVGSLLEGQFPLPFVLVLVGYSFILLIDKVLIDSHDTQQVAHISQLSDQDLMIAESTNDLEFSDPLLTVQRERSSSVKAKSRPILEAEGHGCSPERLEEKEKEIEFKSMFSKLDKFSRAQRDNTQTVRMRQRSFI